MPARWYSTLSLVLSFAAACGGEARPPIDDAGVSRVCPTHLDMELIGSESRFSPGSSGTAHGVGLPQGSRVSVEILSCDDECRRCTFRGPVRGDPATEPVVTQRCLDAVNTTCTVDEDCGTTGPCRYIFPPISANVIVSSCTLVYFDPIVADDPSPMQGTIDLLTGEADLPVFNLAISIAPGAACDECRNDQMPFDGEKTGTCQSDNTTLCDVNGIGTAVASTTSYDCPPPVGFLSISLPAGGTSTASRMWTLDGTRPSCTQGGSATAEPCWCGICTGDGTPCFADNQCASGTCGVAGTALDPINAKNNSCAGTCNWDPIARAGTCSDSGASCFPDGVLGASMVAEGVAEVNQGFYIAQLANLVCMPEIDGVSTGFGIDNIAGFPGPMQFEARFKVTPRGEQP